jgi:hypothetical protein
MIQLPNHKHQENLRLRLSHIQALVRQRKLRVTGHALTEASKDGVRAKDIVHVILTGETIESYPERERLLILGRHPKQNISIHIVCDYSDPDEAVVVTVYGLSGISRGNSLAHSVSPPYLGQDRCKTPRYSVEQVFTPL